MYTILQPLPKVIFDRGLEKGGNMLGMDHQATEKGNCILHQVLLVFSRSELETEGRRRLVAYREAVKAQSIKTGTDVPFEYINYADKTQDPLNSYGKENVAFLRKVAATYDPDGTLRTRMPGGFKIPMP